MHNVICPGAPGHQALQSLAPQGRHTTLLVAPPRSVARSLLSGTQGAESGVHARCGVACGVACARAVQKYILLIHVTFKDRAHFSGLEARAPCRDLELDQLHRVAARLRGVASASLVATLLLALARLPPPPRPGAAAELGTRRACRSCRRRVRLRSSAF